MGNVEVQEPWKSALTDVTMLSSNFIGMPVWLAPNPSPFNVIDDPGTPVWSDTETAEVTLKVVEVVWLVVPEA